MNTSLFIMLAGAAIIAVTVQGTQVDPPENFPHHFEEGGEISTAITPLYRDLYAQEARNPFEYLFRPKSRQCEETKRKLKNLAYELAYLSEAISALADKREDRPFYREDGPFYKDERPYYTSDNYYRRW